MTEVSTGMKISIFAASRLIRAISSTWRVRFVGDETVQRLHAEKTSILFTFWHGEMLAFLWPHRNRGVHILVSEHKDGEIISRILQWMGYNLIRGSTSRGAGRALIGMVRVLKAGEDIAITPDGPRGPRHKYAPGAVIAAQRSGAAILPSAAYVDRFWQLSSWDGFIIPKPFARITIAYGTPTFVSADSPRDAAEEAPRLEALMEAVKQIACA
ncbi:MAG: lysophospholipid acyltransferase family protein [Gemmatimonadales bacterium]